MKSMQAIDYRLEDRKNVGTLRSSDGALGLFFQKTVINTPKTKPLLAKDAFQAGV
jgi:hypothetical protein